MFSTRNIIYLTFSIAVIGVIGIYLQLSGTKAINTAIANEAPISVLTLNTDLDAGKAILAQYFSWQLISEQQAQNLVCLINRQDF